MRYTPYGVPISIPMSDKDRNGELEQADVDAMVAAITAYTDPGGSVYQVEFDNDLDGDIDFTDLSLTIAQMNAIGTDPIGRGVLSSYGHRAGYAGYQWVPAAGLYHVRHRWYDPLNGTWISMDPAGYVDGASLFGYLQQSVIRLVDPWGLGPMMPDDPGWGGDAYTGPYTSGEDIRYTDQNDQPNVPGIPVNSTEDIVRHVIYDQHREHRRVSTHGENGLTTLGPAIISDETLDLVKRRREDPENFPEHNTAIVDLVEEFLSALEDKSDRVTIEACRVGKSVEDKLNELYPDAKWECYAGVCWVMPLNIGTVNIPWRKNKNGK